MGFGPRHLIICMNAARLHLANPGFGRRPRVAGLGLMFTNAPRSIIQAGVSVGKMVAKVSLPPQASVMLALADHG